MSTAAPTADEIRATIEAHLAQLKAETVRLEAALAELDGEPVSRSAVHAPRRHSRRQPRTAHQRRRQGGRPQSTNTTRILQALADHNGPMTATHVSKATGIGRPTASTALSRLARDGKVRKAARGYETVSGAAA